MLGQGRARADRPSDRHAGQLSPSRRHSKKMKITSGLVFRGDVRYGGSTLPQDYSVAQYVWRK